MAQLFCTLTTLKDTKSTQKKGVIIFGKMFVKTGEFDKNLAKHYTDLFEKRHKGDYNDFFDFDKETVIRLLPISKEFISEIEYLINK